MPPEAESSADASRADGAPAVRGQEGHRRPGPPARAHDRRPPRARPSARRGRARAGQDDGHQDARPGDRRRLQAHPVHAGPGAGRPRRDPHLQPEDRRVQHLARPGLHQPAAGRRDQPGAGQGAERAARGHAGTPGDHRSRDAPGPRPVPRAGDPEPDRDRGHVRAARGPGRPVHAQGPRRLPEPDRGVRHRRADDRTCRAGPEGPLDRRAARAAARGRPGLRRSRPSTSTPFAWRPPRGRRAPTGCRSSSATSRSAPARARRST